MVAIRLRRAGSKKRPFFRVVVTDSRTRARQQFRRNPGPLQSAIETRGRPTSTRSASSTGCRKARKPSDSVGR
jgi:ribosomal protein S16